MISILRYNFKNSGNVMKIIFFLFLIFYFSSSFSHECKLRDTTPKEITIYNSCLSQQKSNNSSSKLNESLFKQKIKELKNKNQLLKDKLLNLQNKLRNLSQVIENYANF